VNGRAAPLAESAALGRVEERRAMQGNELVESAPRRSGRLRSWHHLWDREAPACWTPVILGSDLERFNSSLRQEM